MPLNSTDRPLAHLSRAELEAMALDRETQQTAMQLQLIAKACLVLMDIRDMLDKRLPQATAP